MISYEEALTETRFHQEGMCHRIVGPRGGVTVKSVVWRRNGQTQTWKTRPGEYRVPLKYGMRSYDALTPAHAHTVHAEGNCPLNDPEWEG